MRAPFTIGGETILPGTRQTINLPVSLLSTHTPVTVPVSVVHGKRDGATIFVSAAIHGDEIIGVEIIRRLLRPTPCDICAARWSACRWSTFSASSTIHATCLTGAI